jgi:hypothetical protein
MTRWDSRLERLLLSVSAPIALVSPDWEEAYLWVKDHIGFVSAQNLLEVQGDTLGIDAVREVEEFLSLVPGNSVKYALILGADNLTPEAQNAFLKTLEEPPRYARIFLFAQRWSTLLPTIRSRVVNVTLPPKTMEELGVSDYWQYLMCSGSKVLLGKILANKDWAKQVRAKHNLFDKDVDSYKLAAFFLDIMAQNGVRNFGALKDMLNMETALQANVNKEMVFDKMLMTGVSEDDVLS